MDVYGFGLVIDGGAGADVMIGPQLIAPSISGTDRTIRYVVDNVGDVIISSNVGIEQVQTSLSYVLQFEMDDLILTGSDAVSGTGNAGNNTIDGSQNSAANVIDGRPGR